jgi:hypothetical protein
MNSTTPMNVSLAVFAAAAVLTYGGMAVAADDPAEAELTNRHLVVSKIITDTKAAWATNWTAFVAEFQPYFDKGEVTISNKLDLAKQFHAHVVTWQGKVSSITNGNVHLDMPAAPLKVKIASWSGPQNETRYLDSLTITPEGSHSNAWGGVRAGEEVTFRTILVGPALGPTLFGMGPNAGKVIVLWNTKDGELLQKK